MPTLSPVNLTLQAITSLSKIMLLLMLARYLPVEEVGQFGLLVVTLSLGTCIAGLEFYTFNMRQIIRSPDDAPKMIRDQFVLHGMVYCAIIPILYFSMAWSIQSTRLFLLLIVLFILDHCGQELQRILVALQKPTGAALQLFLRTGAWVWPTALLLAVFPASRRLDVVCSTWAIGAAIGLLISLYLLGGLHLTRAFHHRVDWTWIARGIKVALPYLGATLATRGIVAVDRYALQIYQGSHEVGVYTLYAHTLTAIQSFVDIGVLFVFQPLVVDAFQRGNLDRYAKLMRRLAWQVAALVVGLSLVAAVLIKPVLYVVGHPSYSEHLDAFWVVLVAAGIMALSQIAHCGLYAKHRDVLILTATCLGFAVAIAVNVLLVPTLGIIGAAIASLAASSTIFAVKTIGLFLPTTMTPGNKFC